MARVIYLCPADNVPTGGIKVIYRHAEILAAAGVDAYVLHPFDVSFCCTWFEHDVRLLASLDLRAHDDFVIIPELWASIFGPQCRREGVRYAIFVQNGYLTHPILPEHAAAVYDAAYLGADLVLVISEDSERMVKLNYPGLDPARVMRVNYSIDRRFSTSTSSAGKERLITFMPRKMASHAARVTAALRGSVNPGWAVESIHGVNETACAALLARSSLFLAFSEFEGLPLPPIEAALAGNMVVGYTGQGAQEYWDAPIFTEVNQGNILDFVAATVRIGHEIDAGRWSWDVLEPARLRLAQRYSAAAERAALATMMERIEDCMTESGRVSVERRELNGADQDGERHVPPAGATAHIEAVSIRMAPSNAASCHA